MPGGTSSSCTTGKVLLQMPPKSKSPAKLGPGSDDDFIYESSAGIIKVPSLAKAKTPNAWDMMELEAIEDKRVKGARESMLFVRLAAGDDPESLARIKKLDMVEFGEFMEKWADHSGVSLGNS